MPWTKEEKIFCVTTYLQTKSFKTVQAKFRQKFNFNNYPQKSQIYRWAHKFQATGSVNNLNKKAETSTYGRKLTARTPDNVNAVRDSVGRCPKKSIRRRSQELGLSRASVQRILIKDLHLYPYIWFEDADGDAVTVVKEQYIVVLKNFWRTLGTRRGMNRDEQWFQQDGATPHTANITMEWLNHRFPDRLISRRREPQWSPHSPDLNPPDFYLWGFLKDHVYENRPQSIAELKVAITQRIRSIRREECVRVINNFAHRLQACLQRNGGHLEHIL